MDGPLAGVVFRSGRLDGPSPQGVPVLALGFLLGATLAPHLGPRLTLLAAAMMEVVVCLSAGLFWIVPLLLNHGPGSIESEADNGRSMGR